MSTFRGQMWNATVTVYRRQQSVNENGKTVTIEPKKIHYMQEYAVYVYNGDGMNFQTTRHALACAHWDEAAAPMQKDKLVDAVQGYIDSGRLDI